jgi:hypothetical protein
MELEEIITFSYYCKNLGFYLVERIDKKYWEELSEERKKERKRVIAEKIQDRLLRQIFSA